MAKLVVMMNPTIQYLTDIYFGCGMLQHAEAFGSLLAACFDRQAPSSTTSRAPL